MHVTYESRTPARHFPERLKRGVGLIAAMGALLTGGCTTSKPSQEHTSLATLDKAARKPLPNALSKIALETVVGHSPGIKWLATAERVSVGQDTYLVSAGHAIEGTTLHPITCSDARASLGTNSGVTVELKGANTVYAPALGASSPFDVSVLFPKKQSQADGAIPESIPLSAAPPKIGDMAYLIGNSPGMRNEMPAEYIGTFGGVEILVEPNTPNYIRPGDSGGSALEADDSQFGVIINTVEDPLTLNEINTNYNLNLTGSAELYRLVGVAPLTASFIEHLDTTAPVCTFK